MTKRGWCPSLYEPMEAGDGWLVRVKPSCGILAASEAHVLAEAARRHGNGMIGLTNRANLQFRGLTPASAATFADIVRALGLAAADPHAERRRNVLLAPLAGAAAEPVARGIEAMLVAEENWATLPAKFAITVDSGAFSVMAAPTDIGWGLQDGTATLRLNDRVAHCDVGDLELLTRRMIGLFLESGAGRMRDLDAEAILAACRLASDVAGVPRKPRIVGAHAGAFGVGLPFGALTADTLDVIADVAEAKGDGRLHLSPFRAILLSGVDTFPESQDVITDPSDPRLVVHACAGAPSCAHATVQTRADAAWLAARLRMPLHVSGCPKGCAHPGPSAITLIGHNGLYDLVRHGRADAAPVETGLTLSDIASRFAA